MDPSRDTSVPIENHLGLVLRLGAGEARIHIQIFRPGVIGADFETAAEAMRKIGLQRVVARVALGVPEKSRAQIRIRARADRNVLRALRHMALAGGRGWSATGGGYGHARGASGGVRTNLRGNIVGIDA